MEIKRRGFLGAVAGLVAAPMLNPGEHLVPDTLPALLPAGEFVLSHQQQVVIVERNGAKIAEAMLPHLPKMIKGYGLR